MQILRAVYPERSERAQDDSPFESFIPLVNCYLPVKRRVKLIKHEGTIPGENRESSPGLRRSDGDNALRKRHLPHPLFR